MEKIISLKVFRQGKLRFNHKNVITFDAYQTLQGSSVYQFVFPSWQLTLEQICQWVRVQCLSVLFCSIFSTF